MVKKEQQNFCPILLSFAKKKRCGVHGYFSVLALSRVPNEGNMLSLRYISRRCFFSNKQSVRVEDKIEKIM